MSAHERSCAALNDMLQSALLIKKYLYGETEDTFVSNQEKQDAVVTRITIISEAAGRISSSVRKKYSQVPWNKIKGMRNILVHEYERIDPTLVWNVYVDDLDPLISALGTIIEIEC